LKGMIVFSFGWRRNDYSHCNIRLARSAFRIVAETETDEPLVVLFQRTVAEATEVLGILPLPDPILNFYVADKRPGYEGSEEVVRQAAEIFRKHGITEVLPIAQPVLQLTKCVQLVRKAGFRTPSFWKLCRMIGWIGFDRKSVQPWTRGPVRLVLYTMRQMFFGYRPPPELSE